MSMLSMPARLALAGIMSAALAVVALTGAMAQDAKAADKPAEAKTSDAKPNGPVFIVIDPDRILRESLAGKGLNVDAEKYGRQFEEENRKDELAVRSADQELQKQRGSLSQEQLAEKARGLDQRWGEVQRMELRRRQAFERSYNAARLKWQQAMMDASRDVAAAHNADAVVQSQALLFYNTKWDVTNEIIDLLNKRTTKIEFPAPKLEAEVTPAPAAGGETGKKQLQPSTQQQPQPSGGLKLPAQ
jgi:Skp family chaperone for outer membrane proteins